MGRHKFIYIDEEDVKWMLSNGYVQSDIARKYNVSVATVSNRIRELSGASGGTQYKKFLIREYGKRTKNGRSGKPMRDPQDKVLPICPICGMEAEKIYRRFDASRQVVGCDYCIVPVTAREIEEEVAEQSWE